jgi:beta-lactamase regulating signal transducer with metallopeptidase domain
MLLLSLIRKLSPNNRHMLWLLLIYGLILIPILSGFLPYSWFDNAKPLSQRGEVARTFNDLFFLKTIDLEAQSVPAMTSAVPLQAIAHPPVSGPNWPLFMVIVWVAGGFVASFRVIIGRFRLSFLQRDRNNPMIEEYRTQVSQMLLEMGVKKKTCLVTSSRCHIPFTYRFSKPVVVLPAESTAWSRDRVRSVLLHELAHIRRHDYLTQSVARIICALFWYIPFVWIAYSKLYEEQEKACDVFVVERGIRPADYASHILDLACFSMRTVSFQGSFLSKGRKKLLERRILHTLSFKRDKNLLKGVPVQKVVFYTDYKWEEYSLVKHDTPQAYGVYTITDTWKDSDGDIWYTGKWGDNLLGKGYCMGKISDSGNTHEMLWNIFSEPIEYWDLDNKRYYYRIHYRQ